MITLQDLYRPDRPILLDGGMGTELIRRGLEPDTIPEVWNLEHPGQVLDIHKAYVDSGAEIIETNTFNSNAVRLGSAGSQLSVKEVISAACGLAAEAARGRSLVAGSIGPLGEHIHPYGNLSIDDARAAYTEVIETFLLNGVDVLVFETMVSVDEALIALRQALIAGAPLAMVSMTFNTTPQGFRTTVGEAPSDAVQKLQDAGAHAVGSNCGAGLTMMSGIALEIVSIATIPVLMQPSAGIPEKRSDGVHFPGRSESFAHWVKSAAESGVRYLGGCCGTGPEHIRLARTYLRRR